MHLAKRAIFWKSMCCFDKTIPWIKRKELKNQANCETFSNRIIYNFRVAVCFHTTVAPSKALGVLKKRGEVWRGAVWESRGKQGMR